MGQWRPLWTYLVQRGFYWDIAQRVERPLPPFPEEETDIKHLRPAAQQSCTGEPHGLEKRRSFTDKQLIRFMLELIYVMGKQCYGFRGADRL